MALNNNKQSYLEIKGREERNNEIIRSDYNKNDAYSSSHEDALSDPNRTDKPLGKGTGSTGHNAYTPDHSKSPYSYNYDSLDTSKGGGSYDIHGKDGNGGREKLTKINLYNKEYSYGPNLIDTSSNVVDGQYKM